MNPFQNTTAYNAITLVADAPRGPVRDGSEPDPYAAWEYIGLFVIFLGAGLFTWLCIRKELRNEKKSSQ